jgi:putative SOS response-associated peptidase YedK
MCGRFTLYYDPRQFARHFAADLPADLRKVSEGV